jgi:hypothetical protein
MWNTEVGEFEIFAEEEEDSIEDEAVKQVWLLPAFKPFLELLFKLNSANIGKLFKLSKLVYPEISPTPWTFYLNWTD